eukprot:4996111-Pyramimonas_sp.AAC.2
MLTATERDKLKAITDGTVNRMEEFHIKMKNARDQLTTPLVHKPNNALYVSPHVRAHARGLVRRWQELPRSAAKPGLAGPGSPPEAHAGESIARGDTSQSLNRNIPHPPTHRSPSIGTYLTHRPIAVPQ